MADYYCQFRKVLSPAEMRVNAVWIRNYLQRQGWSLNAICACLGNWESECTLNPNRPQRKNFPATTTGGFGLAQWTPWYKKYGTWCKSQGIGIQNNDGNPAGRIEPQIAYHEYECKYGLNGKKTWYNNKGYNYSWENFKRSTDNVATLATAYYWQYERSAAGAVGSRPRQAIAWYNYLSGQPYNPISPAGYNSKPTLQTPFSFGNMRLLYIYLLIMMILGKKK